MKAILALLAASILSGCASDPIPAGSTQAEPKTIIQGAAGKMSWGISIETGILPKPIGVSIFGSRTKKPAADVPPVLDE